MPTLESFPISPEIVHNFTQYNKSQWPEITPSGKYIIINLSMVRMQVAWVIPKLLYAKALQEKTGATPIALTWRPNPFLTEFFESFGIKHVAIDDLCKMSKGGFLRTMAKTLTFTAFHISGEAIKNYKALSLNIGRNIYEDILRTSPLSTIHNCKNKIVVKKLFHITWAMYALNKFIKTHPLEFAVMDDFAYHEAAFIKLFRANGAKILACSNQGHEVLSFDDNGEIISRMAMANKKYHEEFANISDTVIPEADKLISDRFSGKNGREIDRGAFAGKTVLTREELIERFGLDGNKKTVVIMAHTFTDAVFNYGTYYFRDYYDWLEQTLKIARNVDTVNWILKPHPTRHAYNESADSIEAMFERYKVPNLFFMDDDISAESVKNIADLLVTIGGNAGAEFACFGIPAIIVGKPWYAGFGITIEPTSYEEYKDYLENASDIKILDEAHINIAKKLFYMRNAKNVKEEYKKDSLYSLINAEYSAMINNNATGYFMGNKGTDDHNSQTLLKYQEFTQTNDVKSSIYPKWAREDSTNN